MTVRYKFAQTVRVGINRYNRADNPEQANDQKTYEGNQQLAFIEDQYTDKGKDNHTDA